MKRVARSSSLTVFRYPVARSIPFKWSRGSWLIGEAACMRRSTCGNGQPIQIAPRGYCTAIQKKGFIYNPSRESANQLNGDGGMARLAPAIAV